MFLQFFRNAKRALTLWLAFSRKISALWRFSDSVLGSALFAFGYVLRAAKKGHHSRGAGLRGFYIKNAAFETGFSACLKRR
jgi:hypothetical protein